MLCSCGEIYHLRDGKQGAVEIVLRLERDSIERAQLKEVLRKRIEYRRVDLHGGLIGQEHQRVERDLHIGPSLLQRYLPERINGEDHAIIIGAAGNRRREADIGGVWIDDDSAALFFIESATGVAGIGIGLPGY